MDISNGRGIGVSLFVSGCHFKCDGCFNKETWDFQYGNIWNESAKNYFFSLIKKDYISRVSILGGEPLASENIEDVYNLIKYIKTHYKNKKIWLFTGYTIEELIKENNSLKLKSVFDADYVIDGRFDMSKKNLNLDFRGSENQRLLSHNEIVQRWQDETSK